MKDMISIDELRTIVADVLDKDEAEIGDESHFVNELGVNSLLALEVMVTLEHEFDIKITEEELGQITCLKNAYELLAAKKGVEASA